MQDGADSFKDLALENVPFLKDFMCKKSNPFGPAPLCQNVLARALFHYMYIKCELQWLMKVSNTYDSTLSDFKVTFAYLCLYLE